MSEDTRAIWEYAKRNHIPYDTVIAAMEMVEFNPRLDVYAVMLYPTDSQAFTLKVKTMHYS